MEEDEILLKKEIINLIKKYTGHEYIELTMRGNKAIMYAFRAAKLMQKEKSNVIIPDQGGWLTYTQFPKKIGLLTKDIKTDYGVIDLEDLKKHININDCVCFIYTNPAGYYAEQPMKEIFEICKDECVTILDASGGIGYEDLCDGNYADIIVGSFGKWKVVNAGKGGFISFKDKEAYESMKEDIEEELKKKELENIRDKLLEIPERKKLFEMHCEKIKNDLKDFEILHPEKKGINVVVKFKNDPEKEKIIEYCEKEGYEYTICPKYIRVNENAVSIEIKRM